MRLQALFKKKKKKSGPFTFSVRLISLSKSEFRHTKIDRQFCITKRVKLIKEKKNNVTFLRILEGFIHVMVFLVILP